MAQGQKSEFIFIIIIIILHPGDRRRTDLNPRGEHSSLPYHDPDACNGGATGGLFLCVAALLLGAHGPLVKNLIGSRIGDTHLLKFYYFKKLDVDGGALGVGILPGDRWRRSHGAIKTGSTSAAAPLGSTSKKRFAAYSPVTTAPKATRRTKGSARENVVCKKPCPT